jgi:hypothetical protein
MRLRRVCLLLLLSGAVMGVSLASFAGQAQAICLKPRTTGVVFVPAEPIEGQPASIEVSISNSGSSCDSSAFIVDFRPEASAAPVASSTVDGLAAGESTTVKLSYAFPHARVIPYLTVTELYAESNIILNKPFDTHYQAVTVVEPTIELQFERTAGAPCERFICTTPEKPLVGQAATDTVELFNGGPGTAGPFKLRLSPDVGGLPLASTQSFTGLPGGFHDESFSITYHKPGTFTERAEIVPSGYKTVLTPDRVQESITVVEGSSELVFIDPEPKTCDSDICAKESPVVDNKDQFAVKIGNRGPMTAGTFAVKLTPNVGGLPLSSTQYVSGLKFDEVRTLTFPVTYHKKGSFTAKVEIKPIEFKDTGERTAQAPVTVEERYAEVSATLDYLTAFDNPAGFEEWDSTLCVDYHSLCGSKKHFEPVHPIEVLSDGEGFVWGVLEGRRLQASVDIYSTDYFCFIHCFLEHVAVPGHATLSLSRSEYLKALSGPIVVTAHGKGCRESFSAPILGGGECFNAVFTVAVGNVVGKE